MADVVVLGAGVAGLTAAFRLVGYGHRVTVLEAKSHAGGLSQTARDGTVVTEVGDHGELVCQTASLDGLYINLGPGRLPHHHRRILGLCHELGVALEPYVMSSDANWYADEASGRRWRRRRIENDARGHVAELAAATAGLSPAERDMVRDLGDLTVDGFYDGTPRAGDGKVLSREELAALRFWEAQFGQPQAYLWQDSMFQPVGGMDRIPAALLAEIGDRVRYNCVVDQVRTSGSGVRVHWRHAGVRESALFDWCLSSVPLPIMAERVQLQGVSAGFRDAIATPSFAPACKVGWKVNSRFWEDDVNQCYGGISYTNHPISQLWYPSHDFFTARGTLTGAYNYYEQGAVFGARSVRDRIQLARRGGALLHPEIANEELVPGENALAIAWHRVPHQAGGWCHWDPANPAHETAFTTLQDAQGRLVMIGDQVSPWPGWQEGCVATAERAVAMVDGRVPTTAPLTAGPVPVPDSAWLTTGSRRVEVAW